MQKQPLVTVYIPTYNRVELLRRAVESVVAQTYPSIELIIADDCSSDATTEYLAQITGEYEWIHALRNETNSGACVSRNRAIDAAQGEYITGLDDDDYFTPTRIADFVSYWPGRGDDCIALTSPRQKIMPDASVTLLPGQQTIQRDDMYLRNLAGSQVFLRTATMRQVGGFDAALPAWQDYDLLFRLTGLGSLEKVDQASYVVDTSHPHERITSKNYNNVVMACEYFIDKHGVKGHRATQVRSQLLVYRFSYASALGFAARFLVAGDIQGFKAIVMRFVRSGQT